MVHPELTMQRAAGLLVFLLVLAIPCLAGCGSSHKDGETRALRKEGRAGLVSVEGTERFLDGEWRKDGAFVFYDDGGEEIARGNYENGLEEGAWTQRYEDGCRGAGAYAKGQRQGPWETFHRNGRLQDKGLYEAGLRTGPWVSYRDDGTKLREAEYSGGKLNGRVTYFKKDGRTVEPARSGIYEDGEQIKGR